MALISELRKRSWIILVFIALALISFLLMDAFNSNSGVMQRNKNTFAEIEGTEITAAQLDAKYSEVLSQYLTQTQQLLNYQQGLFTLDNQTEFQLREQAWNDLVQENLMIRQLQAAGLQVTEQEKTDLIYGADPHPYIKNYYAGLSPNGIYDAAAFNQYVTFIQTPENQQNNPQAMQAYFDFLMRESLAIREYTNNKYISLFTKADYVPEWMVQRDYEIKNRRVNFEFVDVQYSTIVDSTIQVSDADLKAYYNEHKNKFKQQEASRIVEYIVFPFIPTPKDSADILGKLTEDLAYLATAKSDSAFIAVRSEDPERTTRAYNKRSYFYEAGLDSAIVDSLFTKPVGSIVGPYIKGQYYTATVLKDRRSMVDSADVRHILIATQGGNADSAKTLADSILTAIRGGADFAQLATQYSADGSGAQGGELGWITPQTDYVKPFKEYVFGPSQVKKPEIVETMFGYHIIEVKEVRGRNEYLLAYNLSRTIEASTATADSVDRIANEFYNSYDTPEAFVAAAVEKGQQLRTSPPFYQNQYEIPGLTDSRGIITWAFGAEKGQFNYFNSFTDRIVVAYVKSSRSEGIAELEEVEEQVKLEVIREKKGEQLSEKLEKALGGGKDLASAANSVNSTVKTSTNASLGTPYAPGIGLEPAVVGRVMATEQGKTTPVIAGNRGVYTAKIISITEAPKDADLTLNRNQLTYGYRNKISQQNVLRSMIDKAEIKDNRYMYGY